MASRRKARGRAVSAVPAAPAVPVRRFTVKFPHSPIRAYGHVLTERGWVPDQQTKE